MNSKSEVLERRLSDRNYDKMTKSIKSNELALETKNNMIVKAPTTSQYYENDIHPFKARDNEISNMKDSNPVTVANKQKLMKHQLLNTILH